MAQLRDYVADAGPCLDLWIALDADRQTVRAEFEGYDVRCLLEETTQEPTSPVGGAGSREDIIAAYSQAPRAAPSL